MLTLIFGESYWVLGVGNLSADSTTPALDQSGRAAICAQCREGDDIIHLRRRFRVLNRCSIPESVTNSRSPGHQHAAVPQPKRGRDVSGKFQGSDCQTARVGAFQLAEELLELAFLRTLGVGRFCVGSHWCRSRRIGYLIECCHAVLQRGRRPFSFPSRQCDRCGLRRRHRATA